MKKTGSRADDSFDILLDRYRWVDGNRIIRAHAMKRVQRFAEGKPPARAAWTAGDGER